MTLTFVGFKALEPNSLIRWLNSRTYSFYLFSRISIYLIQLFHTIKVSSSTLPWWLRWQRICLQCRRPRFDPWVRKIPWRREWQPTSVFLPGESHEQRSLVGYNPWSHKELDTTEGLNQGERSSQVLFIQGVDLKETSRLGLGGVTGYKSSSCVI